MNLTQQQLAYIAGFLEGDGSFLMSSQLRTFIHDIEKYLIIKKAVCNKIIEFDQTIISNGGDRHSEAFKNSFRDVITKREIIFAEIQVLNTKGHH